MNSSPDPVPSEELPRPLSIVKTGSMREPSGNSYDSGVVDSAMADSPPLTMTKRVAQPYALIREAASSPPLRVRRVRPRQSFTTRYDIDNGDHYNLYSGPPERFSYAEPAARAP